MIIMIIILNTIFKFANIHTSRRVHSLTTLGSYGRTIATVGASCSGTFRLGTGVSRTFADFSKSCSLSGLTRLRRARIATPGALDYTTSASTAVDGTGTTGTRCSGRTGRFGRTLRGDSRSTTASNNSKASGDTSKATNSSKASRTASARNSTKITNSTNTASNAISRSNTTSTASTALSSRFLRWVGQSRHYRPADQSDQPVGRPVGPIGRTGRTYRPDQSLTSPSLHFSRLFRAPFPRARHFF